jgi:hypothetical protein
MISTAATAPITIVTPVSARAGVASSRPLAVFLMGSVVTGPLPGPVTR